jgi:hypothetical protein
MANQLIYFKKDLRRMLGRKKFALYTFGYPSHFGESYYIGLKEVYFYSLGVSMKSLEYYSFQ